MRNLFSTILVHSYDAMRVILLREGTLVSTSENSGTNTKLYILVYLPGKIISLYTQSMKFNGL